MRAQWPRGHDASVYDEPRYARNRPIVLARDRWCKGYPAGSHGGARVRTTTADHIVPIVEGGTHALANLRGLCTPCNARKGADEARRQREGRPRRASRDDHPRIWREV